ncbi:hypothetical protein TWF696_000672 [Orbilia brochopaga]|uniref:Secreted protein n=1 Tax=Orbilia brochopaga TaxID=3140254 RepID=A0AAV9VED4_9PEZI
MRMHIPKLAAVGIALPLLAAASVTQNTAVSMAAATDLPDFSNPYRRPSFDEHLFPPPPVLIDTEEKLLQKRQSGSSNFIVHMCRDTTQSDCAKIWVSAAQYCYDNEHWFGWTGDPATFKSAKIEGTMCCAFWSDKTCNKSGGHAGWVAQICQEDSGDALVINGVVNSWMCNHPYGSANTKMASPPPEVLKVPTGGTGAPVATQYAP